MGSKKGPKAKGKKAPSKKLDGGLTRGDQSLKAENGLLAEVPSRGMLGRATVSSHLRKFLADAKKSGDFGPVRQYAERLDIEQQRSPDEPILAPFMEALSQLPAADQSLIREQLSDLNSFALPSLQGRDIDPIDAAQIASMADETGAMPPVESNLDPEQLGALQQLQELYNSQSELRRSDPDFDNTPEGRGMQRAIQRIVTQHGLEDFGGPDLTVVDAPEPDAPAGPTKQFRVPNSRRASTYFGRDVAQGMRLKHELEADPERALRQIAGEQMRQVEAIEAKARRAANNGSNVDVFATLPKVVTGVSKKQQDAEAMRGVLQAGAETQINDADSLPEELRQPTSLGIPLRGNPTDYQIASRNKPQAEQWVERLIKASGARTGSTGLLDTLSKDASGNYSMAETGDAPEGIVNLDKMLPQHRAVFMGMEGDKLTHSHAHRTADLVARLLTGKLEEALGYELGDDFVQKITPLMQRSMDYADENPPHPKSTAYQWWDKKAQPGQQGMQFLQGLISDNMGYSTRPIRGQTPKIEGPPPPLELDELEADMEEIPPPPPRGTKSAPPAPIDMGDDEIDVSNDLGANTGMGMGSLAVSPLLRRILSRA